MDAKDIINQKDKAKIPSKEAANLAANHHE
jgi:hypothetical protein